MIRRSELLAELRAWRDRVFGVEAFTQVVEEERAKRLEIFRLARVVFAELAACLGDLRPGRGRSEDGRADAGPVEGARPHELVAHR